MQHEVNAYTEDPQEKFLKKLRKFNLTGDRATGRPGDQAPGIYAHLSVCLC